MALDLIDSETGEVIRTIEVKEGCSVRLVYEDGTAKKTFVVPFDTFVKINSEEMKFLAKELTQRQMGFIASLLPFIAYEDNCIKDGKGVPLNVARIADRLGVQRNCVNVLINELIEEDILYKGKNNSEFQLFMNPWIACKGNRMNEVLQTMFRNYRIRSRGGITWHRLTKKMK